LRSQVIQIPADCGLAYLQSPGYLCLALTPAVELKDLSSTPLEFHFRAHFLHFFLRGLLSLLW